MLKVSDFPNLNSALDACGATFGDSGGELHLDAPTTIGAPYTYGWHNLSIRGEGNASKITTSLPTGDLLTFKRWDGAEIRNLLLQDFSLLPAAGRTSGWAMHIHKGVRTTINNVDLGTAETNNMHYGGLWIDKYDDSRVDDCNIQARHKGILVNGQSDQGFGADLYVGGGTKIVNHRRPDMADALAGAVGIHFAGGQGGAYIEALQVIYCGIGILLDKAVAGVMNREVFLNPGTVVDSCVEDGIRVLDDAIGTLQMTGVWSASNGRGGSGCGIRVQPNQSPIMDGIITGGKFYNNDEDGIALNDGDWIVHGPSLMDNRGYGLHVANAAVSGHAQAKFRRNTLGDFRNLSTMAIVRL